MHEDTVTPRVNMDAEEEVRKALYQHFKENNWWAKNDNFAILFPALCAVIFLKWITSVDLETMIRDNHDLVMIPILFMIGVAILLGVLSFLKYVYHDIPWNRYRQEWSLPSSNIGGILKIYD